MTQELFNFKVSFSLAEQRIKTELLNSANPQVRTSAATRTVYWHCKTCSIDKHIPLNSQGNLLFNISHQKYLRTHTWDRGCRLQFISEIPQCQHFDLRGLPSAQEECTLPSQKVPSGQAPVNSQLFQEPLLPQLPEGDKLVPNFTEPKTPPPQERFFVQEPKATVPQELIVPSPSVISGPHPNRTQEPGHYRPGPQRYRYPESTCIYQSILASKGRLAHTAPHKSVRFYPQGTESLDISRAFAPSTNGSKLIEIHQLYSDLSLQVTRSTEAGYHLSVQRLASPKD
jgi:hypothetical protein